MATSSVYQFKISLNECYGWKDCHLHEFEVRGCIIGIDHPENSAETLPGQKAKVAHYFRDPKDKASYKYDFGDNWVRDIVLEKIMPKEEGCRKCGHYPKCLAGERRGPPEDRGGLHGYKELLKIMADPKHEDYAEKKEWLKMMKQEVGYVFGLDEFDPTLVTFTDPNERWKVAYGRRW